MNVDPPHAKLLATLSRAAAMPEVTAPSSSAHQATDRATSSSYGTNHGATTLPNDTRPAVQSAGRPGWVFSVPFFRFPWCFWFPGLGVFSSWIGVFLAQLLCWCFWFPGLGVFSPGQCVPCPAPVLVCPACPFTCLFVSFRLNFWLPLPTAGFESTYSCHAIKQTKNTAKPSKPFAVKTCQFA